ncbi:MAG: RNA polymerase sigma factor [Kiritimatiellae bacterium]|jgi:RNA polymerase sigma-70 factor (ECF subfamily)|nr:RNA polymerase sigma factor [Kiritimatiellia bacterium]
MENDISREMIIKAKEGDMAAFEEIYRLTSGFVFNTALRIVRHYADAEEIAQEAFVKMHKNLGQFAFQSSLKTWLYRITVNAAISRCRKSSGEAHAFAGYRNHLAAEPASAPFPDPVAKKDNETLAAYFLSKLDPEQRACVVLREMEGLAYNEIAEILGIPINTVRSRLFRARETLLELAKKEPLV